MIRDAQSLLAANLSVWEVSASFTLAPSTSSSSLRRSLSSLVVFLLLSGSPAKQTLPLIEYDLLLFVSAKTGRDRGVFWTFSSLWR